MTTSLYDRNCAFVNFTNISNAIKAIESIKLKPEYANLRIAHGKDRCANPPRSSAQGMGVVSGGPVGKRGVNIGGVGLNGLDGLSNGHEDEGTVAALGLGLGEDDQQLQQQHVVEMRMEAGLAAGNA